MCAQDVLIVSISDLCPFSYFDKARHIDGRPVTQVEVDAPVRCLTWMSASAILVTIYVLVEDVSLLSLQDLLLHGDSRGNYLQC